MPKGKLYLIPTPLGDSIEEALPPQAIEIIRSLSDFIVEDERTARRFLSKVGMPRPIAQLRFGRLSEHTKPHEYDRLINPLLAGTPVGLLSEAGCPCVADPGSVLVRLAHRRKVEVVPLVGPSSILLALMASGLSGQNFAFNGYLPKERSPRIRRIHELSRLARTQGQTQIFIETPYRNNHMMEDLLGQLDPETRVCVAMQLGTRDQWIETKTVSEWGSKKPDLDGRNVVFLIGK
jgi:16S rRNA (cytidine1402-2'-O)-methyltransferase